MSDLRAATLAAVDCETTGTDPATARIVEVAVILVAPGAAPLRRVWRCCPGVSIPPDATAVHGITDADVADAPPFARIAWEVEVTLRGATLVTFNGLAFDVPLLQAEFARCGVAWQPGPVVDVFALDRARTRHDLGAVVRRYLGRDHVGAHGAEADAAATLDVLLAMAGDASVAELAAESVGNRATADGKVLWADDGRAVWGFGKHRGQPVAHDRGFAGWVAGKPDFAADVRAFARRGAAGEEVRR